MVTQLRARVQGPHTTALATLAVCGLIAAYAIVALAGTKTGAVLALATTVGPFLLYLAVVDPVFFPLGLYAVLTPLDNILNVTSLGTVTRILGAASAAALVFYMLRTRRFGDVPRQTVYWLLFYLWMVASMFWAIDAPTAQLLIPTALQLFGLYVVVAMFPVSVRSLSQITAAVMAGGVIAAAYGVYAYHSGQAIYSGRLVIQGENAVLNPDHFGASLLLPLVLCIISFLWSRSLLTKFATIFGAAILLAAIELTGSRGAWLGVAAVLVYLIVRDPHRWKLAFIGVALSAAAVAISGPASFFSRWALAMQNGGAGRVSIWHVGWLAFKQNWIYGAGYANFPFAYDRAFMQTFQSFYANWHRASHNILLNAAVELGVIGLALLVLSWWGQFRLLEHIKQDDIRFPMRLAMEAAVVGLFVCGLFADIMIEKYVWLAFMLVVMVRNARVSQTNEVTQNA
jgi:O-antigen ligase